MKNKIDASWLRLNSFLVMGGFNLNNLPEVHREQFRAAQIEFASALREAPQTAATKFLKDLAKPPMQLENEVLL